MSRPAEFPRRAVLAGSAASAALALAGCANGFTFSLTDAVRRLLFLSSQRAFARMTAPGGFWDQQVASLGLDPFLGGRGDVLTRILTSALFKSRLQNAFAGIARDASKRAAPVVADAVRTIGIQNAKDIIRGGPTAATHFLQGAMGNALIDALAPEVGQALRVAQEPLVGQLLASLTGVDVAGVARSFSSEVDRVAWGEIGREEAAIRADPASTNDALLIGVFGVGQAL